MDSFLVCGTRKHCVGALKAYTVFRVALKVFLAQMEAIDYTDSIGAGNPVVQVVSHLRRRQRVAALCRRRVLLSSFKPIDSLVQPQGR